MSGPDAPFVRAYSGSSAFSGSALPLRACSVTVTNPVELETTGRDLPARVGPISVSN